MKRKLAIGAGVGLCWALAHPAGVSGQERRAFFGDLHIHTRYSYDAFIFGALNGPDEAYRYALGEAIDHPAGIKIQLDRPLDFMAVTDHASALGMMEAMSDPESPLSKLPGAARFTQVKTLDERLAAFRSGGAFMREHRDKNVIRTAWQRTIDSAERFYQPGKLTTFIGYEYTSSFGGNLHRNVIFKGRAAPDIPFSSAESLNPEDLWDWMDRLREQGIEVLAIPHNSNGSNGHMFALSTFNGDALDAEYAAQRMRNEPLVEVTQIKGTSEVHPALAPNDEWADFEIYPFRTGAWDRSWPRGSYVREAYLNGLELEERGGFNPFRFGLIGSSDTHNAGGAFNESNYWGSTGEADATPKNRGSVPVEGAGMLAAYTEIFTRYFGASGLAGVWAEENTRESIFAALERKETFATSGPRIQVRLFAGYDYPDDLATRSDRIEVAQAGGVAMGGDLEARSGGSPRFLAQAVKDALGAPLQRLQIVKGWVEDGKAQQAVYDVACSDGLAVDPATHRCPDNGAKVDLKDCSVTANVGAAELTTLWKDPAFDPAQRAVYYVRVLENPTCRWSTWDATRAGTAPRPDIPTTLQERAWSSPVWYRPAR